MLRSSNSTLALATLLALGGCGRAPAPAPPAERDPIVAAALADPLMVDPDLVEQNGQNLVLDFAGAAAAPIPPIERSDDAIAAARAEAAQLLGASPPQAPAGSPAGPAEPRTTAHLAALAALAELGLPRLCADRLNYAMIWAARLPATVPIYPRGHVQEAAGTDAPPCRLRVVHFLTPIPEGELVDFYWARGRAGGMAPAHRRAGDGHSVGGRRGPGGFMAFVRTESRLSAVDLVTIGLD